ncbi:MAG: hypothetical protein V8T45_05545 [Oscillospiraceae bacterium]
MPEDRFNISGDELHSGPLNAALAVFRANRLLDMQLLDDTEQLISRLLEEGGPPGITKTS